MGIYENKAIALAEKYQTANPFCICNNMGIKIEYANLDNPLGDTIYLNKSPIILLSNKIQGKHEKYFVCAHELGHVVLHNGIQNYYLINRTTKRKMESEADRFAMVCWKSFQLKSLVFRMNIF
ncbi:ImmA/IrrE family metallo-endopeptidase [Liquorilactobacillus mali]|uniref:ImmA/IrrE family metallo-endopeptidase n=1 Tax=Liquorilactobacillus mali TaxID=1618 RepID=UPI00026BE91C|nr:ImmA/IrrE family metallo-endopeptidase [Liquorilactobacillus mali]EJF00807.1 prophage P1 protein 7 [Liquorilactobacillus mali KCTC 3596 = DSM 20444]QFQ74354.1 ImmA/IrrE family metallo-endopeptidase [Liquorilactobacillus mali]